MKRKRRKFWVIIGLLIDILIIGALIYFLMSGADWAGRAGAGMRWHGLF